jgi:4-diphosphocytidyl-2-C-methyl-D-erythritol kinase
LTKPIVNTSIATSLKSFEKLAGLLVNDLESVTLDRYPKIRLFKEKLLRAGAVGGLMSGSGSSVFGLFESKGMAQRAYNKLRHEEGVQAFLVRMLS